ncbi:MAG: DUF1553 domain-containing protein [Bryobacterales bacterium]|nr:DUF1553 domain-containing protein [Bryobacterales bacterium]
MRREFLLVLLAAMPAMGQQAKGVDFQREVRPILSDACFHCHGPDKNSRMAGLRLDTQEGAMARAIVPGKPLESKLYQRLVHTNVALRMPPASTHKVITDAQKETLKAWIEQGAPWKEHWSFKAPEKAAVPAGRNAIDYFVRARLEAEGMTPAKEADRRTLARRVALDLTGLPPEPRDVAAFVADTAPNAYERMVDRYLESPRYGEHRGRYWLDAARYADTHGIHVDNYREMWPYRDWVIQAFNKNMPFDQFTIEQIAGDMLPNRTLEQQIASGFHRCGISTNEAGIIVDEVEAIYAKDRVDTTGTVFMGLTVGCATCHDHKFDPLSQKDFYSMAAFFRNTTQNTMDDNIPDTPPIVVVPREEDRARWLVLKAEIAAVEAKKAARRDAEISGWDKPRALKTPLDAKSQIFSVWDAPLADSKIGEGRAAGQKAIRFGKGEFVTLPNQPVFDADKAFSIATWLYFPKEEGSYVVASQTDPKRKGVGWLIEIGARVANFRMTGDDGKSITVRAAHLEQMEQGSWNHLAISYDGSREQAGLRLYLNGRVILLQGGGDINTRLTGNIASGTPLLLGKENLRGFEGGAIADFQIFNRVISAEEALVVKQWPVADKLRYLTLHDKEYRTLGAKLAALQAEARQIRKRGAVTLVMEERKDRKPTANILYRGMYDAPREEVEPNVPAVLPPMDASYPRNRLGLAKWIVDAKNPLTARVAINRFWQEMFGTGIVKTSEDFGSQGMPPTHPELLDWLAVEFRETGWNVKKMLKLMVMSDTYRQSAATTPEKLKKDPENRLFARGPRFRMDGEVLRDYALATSGLLDPVVGGPSVKPYQPEGVWEAVAMNGSNTKFYKRDEGTKLYRRSLYTFWKRSAPPASMDLFNAPTRENCTVRRERTNTPLQALTTMNDPQFVEASRNLAERAMKASAEFNARLDYVSERVLARPLATKERDVLRRAYLDLQAHYEGHAGEARKLVRVGESKPDAALPEAEFAAWTMLASNVLNLDEALNK